MKLFQSSSLLILLIFLITACNNTPVSAPAPRVQPEGFVNFVKNFDTLHFPLTISNPDFLKKDVLLIPAYKKIDPKDIHDYMKMDSLPRYPIYYYGQLPMSDSTYYLINYFEDNNKKDPSQWWTLMKFDYYGTLLSETNISYCLKDRNEIKERFCQVKSNYQCFYLETEGKWNNKKHIITDTVLNTRTVNLMLDLSGQ